MTPARRPGQDPDQVRGGAQKLTIHDQLMVNLCGWLAVTRFSDPNRALIETQLTRVLPLVNRNHPLIDPLAAAARAVVEAAAKARAFPRLDMDAALQPVFMARAAAAAAHIWPDENTQPETASEPAHAP
jgi:hypothetical protein